MYSLESDPETFAGSFRTGAEQREMDWGSLVDIVRPLMAVVRDSPR